METSPESKPKPSKKQKVARAMLVTKKIESEVQTTLQEIKDKIDQKLFGRKIKDSEVIGKALSLIKSEHIEELKEFTYSSKDRLSLAHADFVKHSGEISLEEFIDRLLKSNIKTKKQN